MENNQSSGSKKNLYIAIIALLLLINGAAIYLLWNENKGKKEVETAKTELDNDFKNLTVELDQKSQELEQLKGHNTELDSVITAQQTEIEEQKKKIGGLLSKGKLNSTELAKAKEMIAQYESSIADLQRRIEQLTQENKKLTSENQQLSSDLVTEKGTTSTLKEQNEGLSKKVALGSLLKINTVAVTGIKKKGNGKEVEVNRIKALESIRISFETGDNKVLENGPLSLYIRIINPKGETISVSDQGSGTIKLAESGETIQYSKKAEFDWNQSSKKVVVYWSQNIKDSGTYKVEVYQSGYQVGKGEVQLK
jgi:hypothetical protein